MPFLCHNHVGHIITLSSTNLDSTLEIDLWTMFIEHTDSPNKRPTEDLNKVEKF